jgi:hypothetical protein
MYYYANFLHLVQFQLGFGVRLLVALVSVEA